LPCPLTKRRNNKEIRNSSGAQKCTQHNCKLQSPLANAPWHASYNFGNRLSANLFKTDF